jgi:uncharacterized membrane protein (DUF106 family)
MMAGPTNAGGGQAPPMPKMTWMLVGLMLMIVMFMFMGQIGEAMNVVMQVFDFGYKYPVETLIITGVIMITLSTVIRVLMTDTVKQQKSQKEMSAFQSELRKARMEHNLYKIKKLTEMQQKMMAKNMENTSAMMKSMPLTMLVILPMFAWLNYFVGHLSYDVLQIAVPWGYARLNDLLMGFMPMWVCIYILISIPFGQLVNRLIRVVIFKKRLKELDSQGNAEVI